MLKHYSWIFILITISSCSSSEPIEIEETLEVLETEKIELKSEMEVESSKLFLVGDYRGLKFSADGLVNVSTNEAGNKLFIQSGDDEFQEIVSGSGVGSNFNLSKDGSKVLYRIKTPDYKMQIESYDIASGKTTVLSDLSPYTELSSVSSSDTSYFLDSKSMEVMATNRKEIWSLTNDGGGYYQILLSPNLKYLVAHKGAFIYSIETKNGYTEKLYSGLACDWSPDSKSIIGFKDESENGHSISSSELFLINIKTKDVRTITATPDVLEMEPSFKNNSTIVYRDELHSGIYEMILNIKEE